MTRCDGAVLENEATGARPLAGRERAAAVVQSDDGAARAMCGVGRATFWTTASGTTLYWAGRRDVVNVMEPYSVSHGHKKGMAKKT